MDHRMSWRAGLGRLVGPARSALLLAILTFAAYALARSWEDVKSSLADVGVLRPLGATCLLALATLGQFMAWRRSLDGLGTPRIAPGAGAAVFLTSQAAKYVPGSIWPVVIQGELGRR